MPPISPGIAVTICVILAIMGGLILTGVAGFMVFLAVQKIRSKKSTPPLPVRSGAATPGLFESAGRVFKSPMFQEAEKILVRAIEDSQHVALNAAVARAFPGLKPFIPAIDGIADSISHAVLNQSAPAAVPTVQLSEGHPKFKDVIKLLQGDAPAAKAA